MLTARTSLARRVTAALDASPSRIPVLLGGCGSGRTTLLLLLRERIGRSVAQYVDVERTATTPERFFRALTAVSLFPLPEMAAEAGGNARVAFDATIGLFGGAKTATSGPATFLLDEFLELRTFESFPGLRRVLYDFADGLAVSSNRFVLTSRYVARSLRLLRDRSARFEVIHMPALTVEDAVDILGLGDEGRRAADSALPASRRLDPTEAEYLARTVLNLADGRPVYVRAIAGELTAMRERGGSDVGGAPETNDAVSALMTLFAPDAPLARHCGFSYELRLHRARGYGALKAILEILAEDEGLTLTEIAQRLQRTPGSTKDYLSWLEDVDLVISRQKRYSFADPLVRLWVRLYCRPSPPTEDDLAREVHGYALPRLPPQIEAPVGKAEPAFAMAGGPPSGIIEID
jgi:Winged helix-turn-helix DNA-binding